MYVCVCEGEEGEEGEKGEEGEEGEERRGCIRVQQHKEVVRKEDEDTANLLRPLIVWF